MVRTNCKNSDNFTTVANKKKRSRKLVVGNAASDVSFKGVARKSVVCVSRLEPGTTVDSVTAHLTAAGVNVISCFELNSQTNRQHFVSMRVCVPHVQLTSVFDASIWPVGVVVRPWFFKPRSDDSSNTQSDSDSG